MRRTILLLALTLGACDRWTPTHPPVEPPTPAQEAATQASDFSQPIRVHGSEWGVAIVGTELTLSGVGRPTTVFRAPGVRITPGKGEWTATAADGRTMAVTLYVSDCSDEATGQRFPMSAEVVVGKDTLFGCAAKAQPRA